MGTSLEVKNNENCTSNNQKTKQDPPPLQISRLPSRSQAVTIRNPFYFTFNSEM